jgi:hypothetical protein
MAKSFLDIADNELPKKEVEATTEENEVVEEKKEEVLENTEEQKEDELGLLDETEEETTEEETQTEEETEEIDETSTQTETPTVVVSTTVAEETEEPENSESSEPTYESDWAKKYDAYYKQYGGTPEDFIEATKDYSSLSQEDVIKKAIRLQNPDFTQEDIDFEYEDLYTFDEEYDDERVIKRKKINFKKALREANRTVSEFQKKFFVKKSQPANGGMSEEQKAAIDEQNRIWRESVEKVNAKIDGITIKVSDDFSFKHKITPDAKKNIKEIAADTSMMKYIEKYKVNDNQLDVERIQRDLFIRDNFESILADAIEQGRQYERALIKKQEKNIDFSGGGKQPRKKVIPKDKQAKFDLLRTKYNIK